MAASATQKDQEYTTCRICSEQYKDPKVLHCLHYFCKSCIEGFLTQQQVEGEGEVVWKVVCPTCHHETKISGGQIDNLPANFFINNLFSLMALQGDSSVVSKICCSNCDDDPPVVRCTTCKWFFCEICVVAHKRGRETKTHALISLDEICKAGPSAAVETVFCKEHAKEDLKYYCENCATLICSECPLEAHQCHKYMHARDAYTKAKEDVLKHLEETKAKEPILKDAIKSVTEMKQMVESTGEKTLEEVSNCFDKLISVLESRRQTMVGDIAKLKQSKVEALEAQQSELELGLASVRSSIEFTEKMLKDGDQVQMLALKNQIEEQLKRLNAATWQLKPCKDHVIRFKTNGKLVEISADLPTFGFISDTQACPRKSTLTMDNGNEGIMYNTLWRQPVKFTIAAKDSKGIKHNDGGDTFTAEIVNPTVNPDESVSLDVNDLGNGSYTFTYTPQTEGQYLLSVKLRGSHVQGAPFTWNVEKWNLTKLPWCHHIPTFFNDSMTAISANEAVFGGSVGLCVGYHLWKVKSTGKLRSLTLGIVSGTHHKEITTFIPNQGSKWLWKDGKTYQPSYGGQSRSSAIASNSTSVFELYLDCKNSQLCICNQDTKHKDVLNGFSGEVFPFFAMQEFPWKMSWFGGRGQVSLLV